MPGRKSLFGYGTDFDCDHWLSLEISGILGSLVSWGVHIFALATLWKYQNSITTTLIFMLLYLPCSALAMVSLAKATLTDPGAVPKTAQPFVRVRKSGERIQRAVRRCHKCEAYKPDRAHHDSVTGRCIVKFDHFCPWVGNAIGALNHKFFCLFLFYTAICCLISLLFLLIRLLNCGYVKDSDDSEVKIDTEPHRFLSEYVDSSCTTFMASRQVLALTIASLVFLVFTLVMGVDQLDAISTGRGKIARMKQQVGSTGTQFNTVTTEFNEMFGGNTPNIAWHWFLPISIRFPRGMKAVVLGYDNRPPDLEAGEFIGANNEEEESPLHRRNSQSEEEIGISMVERAQFT